MDKAKLADKIEFANSNPQIFTRASTTQSAIGYVGLGFVKDGVQAIRYEGIAPSKATIANGRYKIARPLYLFTNGYPELGWVLARVANVARFSSSFSARF